MEAAKRKTDECEKKKKKKKKKRKEITENAVFNPLVEILDVESSSRWCVESTESRG